MSGFHLVTRVRFLHAPVKIMGKLASLRKTIQANPHEWYRPSTLSSSIYGKKPIGAWYDKNEERWKPYAYVYWGKRKNPNSYKRFVRKTLSDLGIKTDKPYTSQFRRDNRTCDE